MLTYLHVKNFALINELEIEFGRGLSVLTGETGAGKSILIGSMNAISGSKLDKSIIRRGQKFALVEMQFELTEDYMQRLATDYGIEKTEDCSVILSRKYNVTGRSIYRANGVAITGQVMSDIFDNAIDIHSQHEHQSLLNTKAHRQLLDQYIGSEISGLKSALKEVFALYKSYLKQLNEDHLNDEHRLREIDFLKFEINEIELAHLSRGEDEQLQSEYKLMANKKKIEAALSQLDYLAQSSSESNVADLLSSMSESMAKVRQLDPSLEELAIEIEQIESMIHDLCRELDHYRDDMENDGDNLDELSERIHVLNSLKQKYGDSIDDIIEALQEKQIKLDELINYEANIKKIKKDIARFEGEINSYCEQLTEHRQKAALKIAAEIEGVLKDLNFNNNQVVVALEPLDQFSASGKDKVSILISTNKNEPVQALTKIASGGELSRVMLALKSVFAEMDQLDTLVFDEIDTGISGRTAQMVAEKMAYLSSKRQLICITHLPQIAAMADSHYLISKEDKVDHVETQINQLDVSAIPQEISRLIGGATITASTLQAAKEMKEQATLLKEIKFKSKTR